MFKKTPDIKAFLGLITKEGRIRYIRPNRKEERFCLPGGGIEGSLCLSSLLGGAAKRARQDFGIILRHDFPVPYLYRTENEDQTTNRTNWNFVVPIIPGYWLDRGGTEREIIDAEPDDLEALSRINLINPEMWRMGLACFWFHYGEGPWGIKASELLSRARPNWKKTGVLTDPEPDLERLRRKLQ